MRQPNVDCTEAESFRDLVTHVSKVSVGLSEGVDRDVFAEDELRLHLLDDTCHLRPQVPGIGFGFHLTSTAERLARESASHDVDAAAERRAVEVFHVLEQLEVREAVGQDRATELVLLDGSDGGVAEQLSAEDAAADAGEQVELSHQLLPVTHGDPKMA